MAEALAEVKIISRNEEPTRKSFLSLLFRGEVNEVIAIIRIQKHNKRCLTEQEEK